MIAYGLGIPDHESPRDAARSSLIAVITAPLVFGLLQLVAGDQLLPRSLIALSAPCFFGLFLVSGVLRRQSRGAEAESAGPLAALDELDKAEFVADLAGPLQQAAELRGGCGARRSPFSWRSHQDDQVDRCDALDRRT